jgi:hypothetical protein
MKPNNIEFQTSSNTLKENWVMRITADRRIEVAEDVDVTETAKKVIEAMQWMLDKQKREWVGLTDDERNWIYISNKTEKEIMLSVEAKLKYKNT